MSAENLIEHISSMMNFVNIQRLWMQRHLEPIAKKYKLKMSDLSLMLLLHINKEIKTAKDVANFSDLKEKYLFASGIFVLQRFYKTGLPLKATGE